MINSEISSSLKYIISNSEVPVNVKFNSKYFVRPHKLTQKGKALMLGLYRDSIVINNNPQKEPPHNFYNWKNDWWTTYPLSDQFRNQLTPSTIIRPSIIFKLQRFNHTSFSGGDPSTPQSLENENAKQLHSPDYTNDIDEGVFYFRK